MSSQLLLFIFLILAGLGSLDITRRAILSILVDRNQQKLRSSMRRLRKPTLPHVTVLVYGKNNARALETTVRQVRQNHYGSFDIVAVSDRSTDDTAARLKHYCAQIDTRIPVAFLQRRIVSSKLKTYQAAYQKSKHGELILLLEAGQVVDRLFIKRAVAQRRNKKQWRVAGTWMKRHDTAQHGLGALSAGLEEVLLGTRSFAMLCQRSELRNVRMPANAFRQLWYAHVMYTVGMVLLIAGFLYGGVIALWYAWLLVSFYLLARIWIQNEAPLSQKWQYTFSVPSALFFMPVTKVAETLIQLGIRK